MDKFSYFIAPLRQNAPVNENLNFFDFIDWNEVEKTNNNTHQQSKIDLNKLQDLKDDAIIMLPSSSTRYFVNSICHDLNPLSPILEEMYMEKKSFRPMSAIPNLFGTSRPITGILEIPEVVHWERKMRFFST